MNINDINELRLILVSRSTDELETMNKLIVEILAVRTEIATAKKADVHIMEIKGNEISYR